MRYKANNFVFDEYEDMLKHLDDLMKPEFDSMKVWWVDMQGATNSECSMVACLPGDYTVAMSSATEEFGSMLQFAGTQTSKRWELRAMSGSKQSMWRDIVGWAIESGGTLNAGKYKLRHSKDETMLLILTKPFKLNAKIRFLSGSKEFMTQDAAFRYEIEHPLTGKEEQPVNKAVLLHLEHSLGGCTGVYVMSGNAEKGKVLVASFLGAPKKLNRELEVVSRYEITVSDADMDVLNKLYPQENRYRGVHCAGGFIILDDVSPKGDVNSTIERFFNDLFWA